MDLPSHRGFGLPTFPAHIPAKRLPRSSRPVLAPVPRESKTFLEAGTSRWMGRFKLRQGTRTLNARERFASDGGSPNLSCHVPSGAAGSRYRTQKKYINGPEGCQATPALSESRACSCAMRPPSGGGSPSPLSTPLKRVLKEIQSFCEGRSPRERRASTSGCRRTARSGPVATVPPRARTRAHGSSGA
jgi:hypothetical protein